MSRGDITYRRCGWFTVEAAYEVLPYAWVVAFGWSKRSARKAVRKRAGVRS